MSFQLPASSISTVAPGAGDDKVMPRSSITFHPSIWTDHFITYSLDDGAIHKWQREAEELKEDILKTLTRAEKVSEKLKLIDAVQRLGVAYHFGKEISEELGQIISTFHESNEGGDDDLQTIALQFRLLREHGYNVSCDVFKKFTNSQGKFNDSLTGDVSGLLSLYEATHLRVHGEDILDEALDFTRTKLNTMVTDLSLPYAKEIHFALQRPTRKRPPRLEARQYISLYQEKESHNEVLLKFAKLDFSILQKSHQKELSIIARWWKSLDFARKLPFARDRIVEQYLWALEVYFEPEYALARNFLAKVIAIITAIDDIYDNYGISTELELFTKAVESWETSSINKLPEYMRLCYAALLDIYGEKEEEMSKEGRSYRLKYAKEAMKTVVRAYLEESKWLGNDYIPKVAEYMEVALVSSAYPMLATTSLVGMGEIVLKEDFEWLSSGPKVVHAISIISRLMDDMVSHKFEQQRKHIPSAVECYMKEYGVTEGQVCQELNKQVEDAWKDINQACLMPGGCSVSVLARLLNLCRVIDVYYKGEDCFTHAPTKLKDYVASVLVNPVEI